MTFYSVGGSARQSAFKAFVNTVVTAYFPNDVSVTVPDTGDQLEDSDGSLIGTWSSGTAATYTGGNAGAWAAGVGVRVRWVTGSRRNNRPIVGTTFIVPCASVVFDLDGNPSAALISGLQTAASTLLTAVSGDMVIWSRPTSAAAADGDSSIVLSRTVPLQTSWLRSRRR